MHTENINAIFADLQKIDFDRPERDPHHNLTDVLEIIAVSIGDKPTFLGGQSRSPDGPLLTEIAAAASKHGMLTRRSKGIMPAAEFLALSPPPVDRMYLQHHVQKELSNCKDDEVLWIYADRNLGSDIESCEAGGRSSASVLGYPECCVDYFLRLRGQKYSLVLDSFRRDYGATTVAELINIENRGVGPSRAVRMRLQQVDDQISKDIGESIIKFPFIHFTACPQCRLDANSPASGINKRMCDLANELDKAFNRKFEDYARSWREIHEGVFGNVQ